MKIKLLLIVLLNIFLFNKALAEFSCDVSDDCEYKSEIKKCVSENVEGAPLSIEDFVCIQDANCEKITFQIILDMKFKEVDEKVEEYLENLEKNKSRYFGPEKTEDFIVGVDDVFDRFREGGVYFKRYYDICLVDDTIVESQKCLDGNSSIDKTYKFFSDSTCIRLVDFKLEQYTQTALDILQLNKQQVRRDSRKEFFQLERSVYNKLQDMLSVNYSFLEIIWSKWPYKIKNPY